MSRLHKNLDSLVAPPDAVCAARGSKIPHARIPFAQGNRRLLAVGASPAIPSFRYPATHFQRVGRETMHLRQTKVPFPFSRKSFTHLSRALTSLSMGRTINKSGKDVYESHNKSEFTPYHVSDLYT